MPRHLLHQYCVLLPVPRVPGHPASSILHALHPDRLPERRLPGGKLGDQGRVGPQAQVLCYGASLAADCPPAR